LGDDKIAVLNFALGAVLTIAAVGAISSYFEKYLTTTVGQWVSHDLRLLLYQRISACRCSSTGSRAPAI
jgi:subfamily B ATP-binding cassette protein MsbA